jgi:hypothetical protein
MMSLNPCWGLIRIFSPIVRLLTAKGCGTLLKFKAGDCCVYCSYGSVKCPPIQQADCCN